MGTAVGWFYVAFTGGLPTLGSVVAGATNPWCGPFGTLWIALGIIVLGGACCLFGGASAPVSPGSRRPGSPSAASSVSSTPRRSPDNKGGAMALLNLGAGGAAFVGPAIVAVFLGPLGPGGVVVVFAGLYVVAAGLTWWLTVPGEAGTPAAAEVPAGSTEVVAARS
ncbi:hypothetical protein [Streptomyces noursei]|uniref:hypothetical protein n=1 Tax=Streptomyces noursei TaxID=1971 RepID=UPI003B8A7D76